MTPPGESSREFATDVVRQLRAAGYTALWAGGCVRDLLLGRGAEDYDVATSATPEQVRTLFGKRRTLAVGESFGVIIVLPPSKTAEPVEVATFRTEGVYLDGRRPTEVAFSTPEEDAQRRDFTINGMFYDPIQMQVLDYVGGEADLHRKVLRAIGDPHARMTEDKLRMLRAVRFAATLEFELDPTTRAAVQLMAPEMRVVSAERIAQELRKVLAHRTRVRGFQLLAETGLLEVLFPEVLPQTAEGVIAQIAMTVLVRSSKRAVIWATLLPIVALVDGEAGRIDRAEQRAQAGVGREIGDHHAHLPLMHITQLLGEGLQPLAVARREHDVGTALRELRRQLLAEARARAGDERPSTRESLHVVWLRRWAARYSSAA